MTDDFDPTAPTLFYQAISPLPKARPLGATVEDAQIEVEVWAHQGRIEIHMPIDFAKQLASQLHQALLDAGDLNRPLRQP
jgi:hypothetical protein